MTIEGLDGRQYAAFKEALMLAFPSYPSLREMAREGLNLRLPNVISENRPLFEVAGELITWAESDGRIDDLISAAMAAKPRNPKLRAFSYDVLLNGSALPSERLEAIVNPQVPMPDTLCWRSRMEQLEASICRIEIPEGQAAGTGFVIADGLVLTNQHVADQIQSRGASPRDCVARFDYRLHEEGGDPDAGLAIRFAEGDWRVDSSPVAQLDYAIIRLERRPGRQPLPAPKAHSFAQGDIYLILHHPLGTAMKMSVGVFVSYDASRERISYTTNTEAGSSGSPVFTLDWKPVALHRQGDKNANSGVPLLTIGRTPTASRNWTDSEAPRAGPAAPADPEDSPPPPPAAEALESPLQPAARAPEMKGLEGVAEEPVTAHLVRRYANDIERASKCAQAIGDIKRLHDLLDTVRIAVYDPLSIAAGNSSQAIDRPLSSAIRELSKLRDKLASAADTETFTPGEFSWLNPEGELALAAQALLEAQETARPGALDDGLHFLRQTIQNQLTGLDSRLSTATRNLDLPALVVKLEALCDDLQRAGVSSARIGHLRQDIVKLTQMQERLHALVSLHQAWQQVDAYLVPLETAIDQTADDVSRGWRVLQGPLRQACPEGSPERTEQMTKVISDFAAAVADRDMGRARRTFDTLSNAFRGRFYQLDQELLAQSGQVRKLGENLGVVMEKLDG